MIKKIKSKTNYDEVRNSIKEPINKEIHWREDYCDPLGISCEISNYGKLDAVCGGWPKLHKTNNGYVYVNLRQKNGKNKIVYVSRLVWYFFGNHDNDKAFDSNFVTHHKDGDPTNNYIDNLELMTKEEHQKLSKKSSKKSTKKPSYYIINKNSCEIVVCKKLKECADYLQISVKNVIENINGRTRFCGRDCEGHRVYFVKKVFE